MNNDENKNGFFSLLNGAINPSHSISSSSPEMSKTQVKSDRNNETQTYSHKSANTSEKLNNKSH